MTTTKETLEAPGARLRYDVQGDGPTLLMIPGGPMDGAGFAPVVPALAEHYRVVTYDPRGLSRSEPADRSEEVTVAQQAQDAHLLLDAVGPDPAHVFGSSGGGITGLELVARYPDQVRTLVAHEPPVTELLPDAAKHRAEGEELQAIHAEHGSGAAMAKFLGNTGLENDSGAQGPRPEGEEMARMMRNLDVFFGRMLGPLAGFRPDAEAIGRAATRVVVAAGAASEGQLAHRAAQAVAEELGTPLVHFPGDHGFGAGPGAFARTLHETLAS